MKQQRRVEVMSKRTKAWLTEGQEGMRTSQVHEPEKDEDFGVTAEQAWDLLMVQERVKALMTQAEVKQKRAVEAAGDKGEGYKTTDKWLAKGIYEGLDLALEELRHTWTIILGLTPSEGEAAEKVLREIARGNLKKSP